MAKTPIQKENKFATSINTTTGIKKSEKPTSVKTEPKRESMEMEKKKETPAKDPHKGGRPSSGPVFRHSLAIPEELMHGVDNAALLHKSNRTAYIVSLIRKDLEENADKYAELAKMIK